MDKTFTCCFTGHRKLPKSQIEVILKNLDRAVEDLISHGVNTFISGGALGFDQIAVSLIVAKKETRQDVRLVFALPCKNQDKFWNKEQKRLYRDLLAEADEVIYVSEEYYDGCMIKRNRYMVDCSDYCVCAMLYPRSGTGHTVRYAIERGLRVVNVVW